MAELLVRQLLAGRDFGVGDPNAAGMQNFVYLLGDREAGECVVVDPAWDVPGILDAAAAEELTVVGALVTHYHPDHIGGEVFGIRIDGLPTLMGAREQPSPGTQGAQGRGQGARPAGGAGRAERS